MTYQAIRKSVANTRFLRSQKQTQAKRKTRKLDIELDIELEIELDIELLKEQSE